MAFISRTAAIVALLCSFTWADLTLPRIFSDHMVLQAGTKVPVWGLAEPGELVTVKFHGQTKLTAAERSGRWQVNLDPMEATCRDDGFDLVIEGKSRIVLKDVLVGEVWLAAGQSNLVWNVPRADGGREAVLSADFPRIRLSSDTVWPGYQTPKAGWVRCTPQTVEPFSALAFFYARHLHRELQVPVGIICRAASGSTAGMWLTPSAFLADADCQAEWKTYCETTYPRRLERYKAELERWEKAAAAAKAKADEKVAVIDRTPHRAVLKLRRAAYKQVTRIANPAEEMFLTVDVPLAYDGKQFSQTFVFQCEDYNKARHTGKVQVVKNGSGQVLHIELNFAGDATAPAARGTYAVRMVRNGWDYVGTYSGTFNGRAISGKISGGPLPLSEESIPELPIGPEGGQWPGHPYVGDYYYRFIDPLVPFAMRGIVWDQGESGSGLLDISLPVVVNAMVKSWRRAFDRDLPFYFVQKPSGGGWRWHEDLRDSDGKVRPRPEPPSVTRIPTDGGFEREEFQKLMRIPNSAMALALDLKDGVHPLDKDIYAGRLCRLALSRTYGRNLVDCGPVYKDHVIDGSRVRVIFDNVGAGLMSRGGGVLQGFMIAGEDRVFRWADAKVDPNDPSAVVLSCEKVPAPVAARYAWAAEPKWANLFNKDGFPALTFRTDDWPKPQVTEATASTDDDGDGVDTDEG